MQQNTSLHTGGDIVKGKKYTYTIQSVLGQDSYGYFWSSSLHESNSYNARYLYFSSGYRDSSNYDRRLGQSVRPVFR